jgi:hypothetical protein
MALLMGVMSISLAAQCKYDYQKADPLTGKIEFKTKLKQIAGINMNKGVANIGYCKASFSKSSRGEVLTLEIRYTNTYKQTTQFNTATDSLYVKFDNGSICALPLAINPSSIIGGSQLHTTETWTLNYTMNEQLKELLCGEFKVTFFRIRTSKFNTDIDQLQNDLGFLFRQCWKDELK